MSRKLWLGLITVFVIFITLQIIFNVRKRTIKEGKSGVPEIIVDMSTLEASPEATILAEELIEKEGPATQLQPDVEPVLPEDPRDIQKALKVAGFDPGPIDGKIGPRTKKAIRAFQKTHDLKVDGKVGRNTWKLLSKYLED